MAIQKCPDPFPDDLRRLARDLACAWIIHPSRPKVSKETSEHWNQLIEAWIASEDMPLFVRRYNNNRGSLLAHKNGRGLVPTDNSPAHWVYALALDDKCPTIDETRAMCDADTIPIAMALKAMTGEKAAAKFKCTKQPANLNKKGWKICHIETVGIGYAGSIQEMALNELKKHFRRTMNPDNMFLVPLIWSGLGEMPEMINAVQRPRTNLADWAEENAEPWGNRLDSRDVEGFTGRRF